MEPRRVVVLGGTGFFGRAAREHLAALGVASLAASRRPDADLRIDAEAPAGLRQGDVVVDCAGPFQRRTTALLEAACEVGFDVVDLNDALGYAEATLALEARIAAAGIRVLPSASSVSAVAACVVRRSGVAAPARVTAFIAPATRRTANPGSARSLLRNVGRPVRVWRDGRFESRRGWGEGRRFPMPAPVGRLRARLFESADSLWIPRLWPTVRDAATFVDPRVKGLGALLRAAARWRGLARLLERHLGRGTALARVLGSEAGGLGYAIEDAGGAVARFALVAPRGGPAVPVAPAVLAVRALYDDAFAPRGLVPPDRHVEPDALFAHLTRHGVTLVPLPPDPL